MAEDRQARIEQTMSSVTPARLAQARQEVEAVRQKGPAPEPPPVPSDDSDAMVVVSSDEEAPCASYEEERLKKLDLIQDVQLILIDKYRLGTRLLWVAIALLTLCSGALGALVHTNVKLYNRIASLSAEQQKLIESKGQIEKRTNETKEKLDETKEKVDQAVEAAPKIEIDSSGKAKVVLPVRQGDDPKKVLKMTPPEPPSAPPSTSAALPIEGRY